MGLSAPTGNGEDVGGEMHHVFGAGQYHQHGILPMHSTVALGHHPHASHLAVSMPFQPLQITVAYRSVSFGPSSLQPPMASAGVAERGAAAATHNQGANGLEDEENERRAMGAQSTSDGAEESLYSLCRRWHNNGCIILRRDFRPHENASGEDNERRKRAREDAENARNGSAPPADAGAPDEHAEVATHEGRTDAAEEKGGVRAVVEAGAMAHNGPTDAKREEPEGGTAHVEGHPIPGDAAAAVPRVVEAAVAAPSSRIDCDGRGGCAEEARGGASNAGRALPMDTDGRKSGGENGYDLSQQSSLPADALLSTHIQRWKSKRKGDVQRWKLRAASFEREWEARERKHAQEQA